MFRDDGFCPESEAPNLSPETWEEPALIQTHNSKARLIIADGLVTSPKFDRLGLTGEGEIVAVADSGLDTGDLTTIHPDFRGRVKSLRKMPIAPFWRARIENVDDKEVSDRNEGHGTHLCGSILGDGSYARELGLEPIEGVAPKAKLIFQVLEYRVKDVQWNKLGEDWWRNVKGEPPPEYYFLGLQDNLTELLQAAYDEGARIFLMAWSGGTPRAYDRHSQQLDQFVWEHQDMLVLVAAGNDGLPTRHPLQEQDIVALGSIKPPATAKNCLTVGATETDRSKDKANIIKNGQPSHEAEQLGTVTYRDDPKHRWLGEPFRADSLVNDIDHIYAMSSRGPTQTGRRKPDVVAPGTFILSTRSRALLNNKFGEWAALRSHEDNQPILDYMYNSGTSMSAALVAGCAALVRQYLRENHPVGEPSAALIKALLIHSAQYHPYEFAHPTSLPWADNEQGWGRVTLRTILKPQQPQRALFLDRDRKEGFKQTGEPFIFKFNLQQPTSPPYPRQPLRLTLVYTDRPGHELINNLDLSAQDPNGKIYLGNGFAGLNAPDSTNNVEGIIVEYPAGGCWKLQVTANNLPQDDCQGFALVVSGPIEWDEAHAAAGWQIIKDESQDIEQKG